MDEVVRQILFFARGMWSKKWLGLSVAWVIALLGLFVVMRMPDKYEASAKIYVDTQSVLKPLMQGLAVDTNIEMQLTALSSNLISRPNMEKLVRMTDLDLKLKSKDERDRLVDELLSTLKLGGGGQSSIYSVVYRHPVPETAKKIVQGLVTIFVESGTGDKRKDQDAARRFIEEQIGNYERRLIEAENRLKEFKLNHIGQIDKNRDYFAAVSDMTSRLQQARQDLNEAVDARDAIKRQLTGEDPILVAENFDSTQPEKISVPELDGRIDIMKKTLDSLLQRFTEKHPDVIGARRVIADLEAQKRQEVDLRLKAGAGMRSSMNINPVYQQLKVTLTEADANVAALTSRVNEFQARLEQMISMAKQQPEIEAEFVQLNRDYEVNRKNYETLVVRRESAAMSEQLDATSALADFRLIEPPRVSSKPVAPNRLLLLPVVLILAIILGAVVSLGSAQLRPTYMDARTLGDSTGLPVLGSVSMLKSEDQRAKERRSLINFLVTLGAMFPLYGVAMFYLVISMRK